MPIDVYHHSNRLLKYIRWRIITSPIVVVSQKVIAYLISICIFLILYFLRSSVRVVDIYAPYRIGHQAFELDYFVKKQRHSIEKGKLVLVPFFNSYIANKAVLNLYKSRLNILILPSFCWKSYMHLRSKVWPYRLLSSIWIETADIACRLDPYIPGFKIVSLYVHQEKNVSIYEIPSLWEKQRIEIFQEVGFNPDCKYVCIHARDNTYAPFDSKNSSSRNSDINCYLEACRYLASKNIQVVRMGNDGSRPFVDINDQIFDYANSRHKSEEADIAIFSKCLFLIGSNSGVAAFAKMFGKPILTVNHYPYELPLYGSVHDLTLYKHLRHKHSNRRCPISLFNQKQFYQYTDSEMHDKLPEYELLDNKSEEILMAVKEMVSRIQGDWIETKENKDRQARFLLDLYGGIPFSIETNTRVAANFLEKYFSEFSNY